jgi:hypothetical protein
VIVMLAVPSGGGAALAGMSTAIDAISRAANSGGFGISHDGGKALMSAIDHLAAAVSKALNDSAMLSAEPRLGSTPAANVYKPFLATVASDPVQGAIPALTKLHADLINAHAAIQKAMQNFQDSEQTIASSNKAIQA